MSGRSGLIVRIRLPPELEELRQHHDPMAHLGVPAHVTLLYPFLPSAQLTPAVRRRIAHVTRDVRPFDVGFEGTGRFPGVVWLAPEPAEPFVTLTELLAAAFPDHPPYGGAHDEIVPHLTLGLGAEDVLGRLARSVRACPPFRERIRAIEVIAESGTDRWHRRWRIPLGPAGKARSTAPPGSPRTVRR
jgi:2'-5' RNA ligase